MKISRLFTYRGINSREPADGRSICSWSTRQLSTQQIPPFYTLSLTSTSFKPVPSSVFCAYLPHLHQWRVCSLKAVYWCALIEHECLIVFLKHWFSWSLTVLCWCDTVGVDTELKPELGLMQFDQLMLSTDWLWLGFYRMMNSVLKTVDYRSEHWYKSDVRNVSRLVT